MAIVWMSETEAEVEFADTLTQWATMYGYKGGFAAEETKQEIVDTKAWAMYSPTARKLMHYIERSEKKIVVYGMRGGYQCFDSTAGRNKDLPVIFIDLGGKLTVNVRGPHNIHLDPNLCTGNVLPLDNRIAVLHEFGHSKQWIERPNLFDNKKKATNLVKGKLGGGGYDPRLEKKTFADAIREAAIKKRERRGKVEDNLEKVGALPYKKPAEGDIFPSAEDAAAFVPPVWGPVIEMDNMARHEWTICREMGLPMRANYRDINCTSDAAPSTTSMIRRKVEDQLAKEKQVLEAKQREAERQIKARTASSVCQVCGEPCKNALALKVHMNKHI